MALPAPATQERARRGAAVVREGGLVSLAVLAGNALSYLLTLIAIRTLAPAAYSELAALFAVLLIGTVPMTALQLHVALDVARGVPDARTAALARGFGLALTAGVLVIVAAPALDRLLDVGSLLSLVAVAAAVVPLTVAGALQGLLQGARRFDRLASVLAAQGVGKVAGALGGLALGHSPLSTLTGMAVGAWAATALCWWLAMGPTLPLPPRIDLSRAATAATSSVAALFVLVNLDLLAARHLLGPSTAGAYAAGAVLAKIAFWAPQAVWMIALPGLADPAGRRRVLRQALTVLALVDGALLVGALVLSTWVARVVFGPGYAGAAPLLAGFTLLGASWAVIQLLGFGSLAAGRDRVGVLLWTGAGSEALLLVVLRPDDPGSLLTLVVAAGALAVGVLAVTMHRRVGVAPR